jgi:hypothetical protein
MCIIFLLTWFPPASAREESLVQKFVAHDDVQSNPLVSLLGPPVEMDLLTNVERLEHNDSPTIVFGRGSRCRW